MRRRGTYSTSAGRKYRASTLTTTSPSAGVQLGGAEVRDADELLDSAVQLAKEGRAVVGVQAAQVRPGLPAMVVTGFPDLAALTRLPMPVEVLRKPFRRQEFVTRLKVMVEGRAAAGRSEAART